MGNDFYKILGSVFMLMSGILYTIERVVTTITSSKVHAEYVAQGIYKKFEPEYPIFFDNFFVVFFLLVGFVILAYGFPKKSSL